MPDSNILDFARSAILCCRVAKLLRCFDLSVTA